MPGSPIYDWLKEQEQRKNPSIFIVEWVFTFALGWFFWTAILSALQHSYPSPAAVGAFSALYGFALVYLRLFKVTGCGKCSSPLPLLRVEIARRRVRDEELSVEVEHGTEAWMEHYMDLYSRLYHVDIVHYRCRRCHAKWEETEKLPASGYRLVRTINLNK